MTTTRAASQKNARDRRATATCSDGPNCARMHVLSAKESLPPLRPGDLSYGVDEIGRSKVFVVLTSVFTLSVVFGKKGGIQKIGLF
jgi:hypothetical protein